jgi:hypothetical protein
MQATYADALRLIQQTVHDAEGEIQLHIGFRGSLAQHQLVGFFPQDGELPVEM